MLAFLLRPFGTCYGHLVSLLHFPLFWYIVLTKSGNPVRETEKNLHFKLFFWAAEKVVSSPVCLSTHLVTIYYVFRDDIFRYFCNKINNILWIVIVSKKAKKR
jgi:hypothetical protein